MLSIELCTTAGAAPNTTARTAYVSVFFLSSYGCFFTSQDNDSQNYIHAYQACLPPWQTSTQPTRRLPPKSSPSRKVKTQGKMVHLHTTYTLSPLSTESRESRGSSVSMTSSITRMEVSYVYPLSDPPANLSAKRALRFPLNGIRKCTVGKLGVECSCHGRRVAENRHRPCFALCNSHTWK